MKTRYADPSAMSAEHDEQSAAVHAAFDKLAALRARALAVDPEGEQAALERAARGEEVGPHWSAVLEASKKVIALSHELRLPEQLEAWEQGDARKLATIVGKEQVEEKLSEAEEWAASIDAEGDDELCDYLRSQRSKIDRMRGQLRGSQLSGPAPLRSQARGTTREAGRRIRRSCSSSSRDGPSRSDDDEPHDAELGRSRGRPRVVPRRARS